ncbi:MAG: hypothetical protein ACR2NN_22540 [Bryobacteraceae bacterium]
MPEIIFCMQFKGTGTPGAESGVLKATTSATSCSVKTVVGPDGVTGSFIPAEGGLAYFESEVRMTGTDTFLESGTITFGEGDHSLTFSTVGQGHIAPEPGTKTMLGAVMWKVDSGEGQFKEAIGLITSNFSLDGAGSVIDHQFGVITVK